MLDKVTLIKRAKTANTIATYVNLPCAVVSFVMALHAAVIHSVELLAINTFLFLFNFGCYILNCYLRDFYESIAALCDEEERHKKISELNPHK